MEWRECEWKKLKKALLNLLCAFFTAAHPPSSYNSILGKEKMLEKILEILEYEARSREEEEMLNIYIKKSCNTEKFHS